MKAALSRRASGQFASTSKLKPGACSASCSSMWSKSKNVEHLPPSYAITVADLQDALIKQGLAISPER
jgi:hypothetical protein